MRKVFIAGCGYMGERIARLYQGSCAEVICMVRSPGHSSLLQGSGFSTMMVSLDNSADIPQINLTDSVLFYLVPPPGGGVSDSRARNFIKHIPEAEKPSKIIYMSATSVYSEKGGKIVTEKSLTAPDSAMGKRRLDAEAAFTEYGEAMNIPVIILRVSGIYGPGRLPLMQISQGQPLLREEESGPSNRIHADDLAAVCIAAANKGVGGDIFNISDGHPTSMTSYFNASADALGYPRQPLVSMAEARQLMLPLMLSYITESRIVDNQYMLERLGITLTYPTIREGLLASLPVQSEPGVCRT